jgi:linoleoyl-CoA desaturase
LGDVRAAAATALTEAGCNPQGGARVWFDVLATSTWFFGSYLVLLLVPLPPAGLALAIVSAGLALTAGLTHVVHPMVHGGVARGRRTNLILAQVLCPFGVSWRWWALKHNAGHHGYVNVDGYDPDLDQGVFFRYASTQPWRAWHRYQHLYAWPVYSLLTLRFILSSDLGFVLTGRFKGRQVEPASVRRAARVLLDKLGGAVILLTVAFVLHPAVDVVLVAVAVLLVNGLSTVLVFVPSHYTEGSDAIVPDADGRVPEEWAASIMGTTNNLTLSNPALRWYVGGMDHHVEHHLLPRVANVNLPVIAPAVRGVCDEHGLHLTTFPTLRSAWASHYRRLRALGRAPESEVAALPSVV